MFASQNTRNSKGVVGRPTTAWVRLAGSCGPRFLSLNLPFFSHASLWTFVEVFLCVACSSRSTYDVVVSNQVEFCPRIRLFAGRMHRDGCHSKHIHC